MDSYGGAVPSTLHQKINFIVNDHLICVIAEEDMIVATSTASYVEVKENTEECSFKSLKFVNAVFIREGQKILMPYLSRTTRSGLKQVWGKMSVLRQGLERNCKGR